MYYLLQTRKKKDDRMLLLFGYMVCINVISFEFLMRSFALSFLQEILAQKITDKQ